MLPIAASVGRTMDILGSHVLHKTFGRGEIVGLQDNRILVVFNNTKAGIRKSIFLLPESFLGVSPFLQAEEDTLASYINGVVFGEFTCHFCKKQVSAKVLLNEKHLCSECSKYASICKSCGSLVDTRSSKYTTNHGRLCMDCYSKLYFSCCICGNTYERGLHNPAHGKSIPENEKWCYSCALNNELMLCRGCNLFFSMDSLTRVEGIEYCDSCLSNFTAICSKCGVRTVCSDKSTKPVLCRSCAKISQYKEIFANIDFTKLRVCRENVYSLEKNPTTVTMTMLHSSKWLNEVVHGDKKPPDRPYYDVLLISGLYYYPDMELVVIYGDCIRHLIPGAFKSSTMTVFKQERIAMNLLYMKHDILQSTKCSDGRIFELWQSPFRLRAKTDYDTFYGKEWHGRYLVYEGNNYGDTSDFYVIGMLKPQNILHPLI